MTFHISQVLYECSQQLMSLETHVTQLCSGVNIATGILGSAECVWTSYPQSALSQCPRVQQGRARPWRPRRAGWGGHRCPNHRRVSRCSSAAQGVWICLEWTSFSFFTLTTDPAAAVLSVVSFFRTCMLGITGVGLFWRYGEPDVQWGAQ